MLRLIKKNLGLVTAAAITVVTAGTAGAATEWDAFVIRQAGASVTPVNPVENDAGNGLTVLINEGGEKAGYGTSFFNGSSIRDVGSISYTRKDAGTSSPYVNIWVTDGTRHAVVAPNVYSSYGAGGAPVGVDVNGRDIQSLGVNIYETNTADLSWLAPGAVYNAAFQGLATKAGDVYTPVKVGDLFESLTVYGNTTLGGTGAPKNGHGFNLVFGDSGGNFVSSIPYEVDGTTVTAVPEPAGLGLMALGGIALLGRRGRRDMACRTF